MAITTTPSGGPQGEYSTYTPIYSQTLSSSTTSITFSSIPTTYTDLELVITAKSDGGYASLVLRCNSDSSSLYSSTYLQANGTSATSGRIASQSTLVLSPSVLGISSNEFTDYKVSLYNYSNTTTSKSMLLRSGAANQGTQVHTGLYRSTSSLTSLTLSINSGSNFVSGSTFTIYGIRAA